MNRDSFVGIMTVIFILFLPFVMNPVGLIVLGITGPFALVGIISIFKSIDGSIDSCEIDRYPDCKKPLKNTFTHRYPEPTSKVREYEYLGLVQWEAWEGYCYARERGFGVIEHRIGGSYAEDKIYCGSEDQRSVLCSPTTEEEVEKLHEFPCFMDFQRTTWLPIKVYKNGYPPEFTRPRWKFW